MSDQFFDRAGWQIDFIVIDSTPAGSPFACCLPTERTVIIDGLGPISIYCYPCHNTRGLKRVCNSRSHSFYPFNQTIGRFINSPQEPIPESESGNPRETMAIRLWEGDTFAHVESNVEIIEFVRSSHAVEGLCRAKAAPII